MTRELRWRIITLQVIMVVVLVFGAGLAFWGSNFTNEQVKSQLEPQKIFFPTDVLTGVPEPEKSALTPYLGQQVVNGEQAHVFAENYLGLHLRELADGKVYSELSTLARTEKDPAKKAVLDGAGANRLPRRNPARDVEPGLGLLDLRQRGLLCRSWPDVGDVDCAGGVLDLRTLLRQETGGRAGSRTGPRAQPLSLRRAGHQRPQD